MRSHVAMTLGLALLVAGCSGGGGNSTTSAGVTPSTPSPTPAPIPTPTPTPTPPPTPTPEPTPSSYLTFTEFYTFRLGRDAVLPSACSGLAFQGQPPAVLPTTLYGEGLNFRYVLTPQVWAFSGDVSAGFDARDGDPFAGEYSDLVPTGVEVGYSRATGAGPVRFSIGRPRIGEHGLDYMRVASVWAPFQGVRRQYHCLIGMPTLAPELQALASGTYGRTVLVAQAQVRDGTTSRAYSLGRSVVSISADAGTRRVTISLRLIGTIAGGGTPDVELGTFTASAPIDPATGNFSANLTSGSRSVTGSLTGRFFGPQALEIGGAVGASVAEGAGVQAFAFAGAVYGAR